MTTTRYYRVHFIRPADNARDFDQVTADDAMDALDQIGSIGAGYEYEYAEEITADEFHRA